MNVKKNFTTVILTFMLSARTLMAVMNVFAVMDILEKGHIVKVICQGDSFKFFTSILKCKE